MEKKDINLEDRYVLNDKAIIDLDISGGEELNVFVRLTIPNPIIIKEDELKILTDDQLKERVKELLRGVVL